MLPKFISSPIIWRLPNSRMESTVVMEKRIVKMITLSICLFINKFNYFFNIVFPRKIIYHRFFSS
jgi:hypothetical protein